MKRHQVHPNVREGRICEGSSPRSAANQAGPRSKMECRVRYLWLRDKHERQAPTRWGILSLVSSVYDPLGFAAPFTLPAKALLQDLCRQNLYDPIPAEELSESIFWTDSTCILGYIANKDKQFHSFVANRVTAIQEATSPSQWKHIDTKQNPADGASCGLSAEALLKGECWLTGQDFLWKSERFWPSQQTVQSQITTWRSRKNHKCFLQT